MKGDKGTGKPSSHYQSNAQRKFFKKKEFDNVGRLRGSEWKQQQMVKIGIDYHSPRTEFYSPCDFLKPYLVIEADILTNYLMLGSVCGRNAQEDLILKGREAKGMNGNKLSTLPSKC